MLRQPESLLVTPSPGFVVKTRGTHNGEKFFLNILGSEHVEAPHMKSLLEADGQKGIRIPISVGERVEERDKSGEPCECVDLVISSKSISDAEADVEFKQMVCQIAIQAVSQKYKLELEPRFTLPRLKYKGATVRAQRIRIKKESQIEEITESSVISTDRIVPPFTITYSDKSGNQIDGLLLPCYQTVSDEITRNLREKVFGNVSESTTDLRESLKDSTCHITIPFEGISSSRFIQLRMNPHALEITFTGISRPYDPFHIRFPFPFNSDSAEALWKDKTLSVSLKCF